MELRFVLDQRGLPLIGRRVKTSIDVYSKRPAMRNNACTSKPILQLVPRGPFCAYSYINMYMRVAFLPLSIRENG